MALAALVFLPLIIPAGLVVSAVERRCLRRIARSFPCVRCGDALGAAAVQRADGAWRQHLRDLHRAHPFVKFRIVRTCHAICTFCGAHHTFREAQRDFVAAD